MKKIGLAIIMGALICLVGCDSDVEQELNMKKYDSITVDKMENKPNNSDQGLEESDDYEMLEVQEDIIHRVYTSPELITKYLSFSTSSTLEGDNYSEGNLNDGEFTTAWVEGMDGYGIGEKITISCDKDFELGALLIYNGYQKRTELWNKNSQVKSMNLYLDDEFVDVITLEKVDGFGQSQRINFEEYLGRNINSITLEITEVYEGTDYSDTCISEIGVIGYMYEIITREDNFVARIEMIDCSDEEKPRMKIQGIDRKGEQVWEHVAEGQMWTELDLITEIGVYNELYYFVHNGNVVTLDIATGDLVWKSESSCGAGNSFIFDENYNLYITGFYGPDLLAMDKNGKTIFVLEDINEYCWPYNLRFLDDVLCISFDSEVEKVEVYVNPNNGEVLE